MRVFFFEISTFRVYTEELKRLIKFGAAQQNSNNVYLITNPRGNIFVKHVGDIRQLQVDLPICADMSK